MIYYLFVMSLLIASHFSIYRREVKRYLAMFLSLFLIITSHILFIYSLVPEYWKNIDDEVSFYGSSNYYYMSMVDLFFYVFFVVWLIISLLILVEFLLNKIQKIFIEVKAVRIVILFVISAVAVYFLIYCYFIDEFIQSVNAPGFEFWQHRYLFFADILLFVLAIELIWYRKN